MQDPTKIRRYVESNIKESVEELMSAIEKIGLKAIGEMGAGEVNTYCFNVLALFMSNYLTSYVMKHSKVPIQVLAQQVHDHLYKNLQEILLKYSGGKTIFSIEIPLNEPKED